MKRFLNAKTILAKFCVGVAILFAGGVFVGCEKNEVMSEENVTENIVKDIEVKDGILCFKNDSVFNATVEQVNNMNEQDFETWEKSIGFTSLKTLQNNALEELEYVESEDDILEFVTRYADMFEIVINQDGEQELKPIVSDFIFPLLINKQGIYVSKDKCYKKTQDLLIETSTDKLEKLKLVTEKNINNLEQNDFIVHKKTISLKTGCGIDKSYDELGIYNNTLKVRIEFTMVQVSVGLVSNYAQIKVSGYQKLFGIWCSYRTNLTLYASSYNVHYPVSYNGVWQYADLTINVPYTYSANSKEILVKRQLNSFDPDAGGFDNYYFNWYFGGCKSTATEIFRVSCGL